ncbi:Pyridoxal-dependent decarboxylase domain-containing protein 1 [Papilio xuthus]|uniref:Pyridoxal-dependent decarboxylase domain-containing protein 1 n=1 Tax=Papilio xuthus TaxID=66420 RepID=A0A0N1PGF8_PAPXU|nr:Pyridoxal-dependent decarboxylase domain-containing protein 1 [Papilio xuthus]
MGDTPTSELESNKESPKAENNTELDRRPFGGLEFQVSEVVGRLEAVVNAQDASEEEKKPEPRKMSCGFFEPEESSMDEILKVLEDMVIKTDPNAECVEPPLLPTDAMTRAAILSHSISALFARLERSHAMRLGAHIASETTRWMAHLFRLVDYNAFYHQDNMEGLVRVTRMLLHHRYPRYLEDGALAFSNRLPSIYSCVASPLVVVQHLCRQLSLPLACVRPVPVHPFGMVTADTDVDELLELVVAAGKDVEDNSRALTDMTEVLKKGIEEAQAELERDAWQEGLLRRVPVVGRVVSWWAPPAPPAGRRLLLTHGTLQPTTDIYRYVLKKDKSEEEPARAHSPARQHEPSSKEGRSVD